MSQSVMMVCGCRAMAHRSDGTPSCFTHDCDEVSSVQPDLTGRVARCTYRDCKSERPSSPDLAFFVYRGAGSYVAATMCARCTYAIQAHWPKWKLKLHIERRWFKHEHTTQKWDTTGHQRDGAAAKAWAEREADRFRAMKQHDTEVFSATVEKLESVPNEITRTHAFTAHGPWDTDEFYCGCKGWD